MSRRQINHEHVEQTTLERLEALQQAAEEIGGIVVEVIANEGEEFEFRGYQVTVDPQSVGIRIAGSFPDHAGTRYLRDRANQILKEREQDNSTG